jgi:hypothetical protein
LAVEAAQAAAIEEEAAAGGVGKNWRVMTASASSGASTSAAAAAAEEYAPESSADGDSVAAAGESLSCHIFSGLPCFVVGENQRKARSIPPLLASRALHWTDEYGWRKSRAGRTPAKRGGEVGEERRQ